MAAATEEGGHALPQSQARLRLQENFRVGGRPRHEIVQALAIANKAGLSVDELEEQVRREMWVGVQKVMQLNSEAARPKGLAEGRVPGLTEGRAIGLSAASLRFLTRRFATVSPAVRDRIDFATARQFGGLVRRCHGGPDFGRRLPVLKRRFCPAAGACFCAGVRLSKDGRAGVAQW